MPNSRASPMTCGGISRSIEPEISKLSTIDAVRGTLLVGHDTTRLVTGSPSSNTVTSDAVGRSGEPFGGATISCADIRVGALNRTANGSTVCARTHAGSNSKSSSGTIMDEWDFITIQHTTDVVVSPYGKSLDILCEQPHGIHLVSRRSSHASGVE